MKHFDDAYDGDIWLVTIIISEYIVNVEADGQMDNRKTRM